MVRGYVDTPVVTKTSVPTLEDQDGYGKECRVTRTRGNGVGPEEKVLGDRDLLRNSDSPLPRCLSSPPGGTAPPCPSESLWTLDRGRTESRTESTFCNGHEQSFTMNFFFYSPSLPLDLKTLL